MAMSVMDNREPRELKHARNKFERKLESIACRAANNLGYFSVAIRCVYDQNIVTFSWRHRPAIRWRCSVAEVKQIVDVTITANYLSEMLAKQGVVERS